MTKEAVLKDMDPGAIRAAILSRRIETYLKVFIEARDTLLRNDTEIRELKETLVRVEALQKRWQEMADRGVTAAKLAAAELSAALIGTKTEERG